MFSQLDHHYMELAREIAQHSPHLGRKTSVVFVDAVTQRVLISAANTFPDGVNNTPQRLIRPACYTYIEHAERQAVAHAAKFGVKLLGTTAYLPWFPCYECARVLVNCGTRRMVCVEPDWTDTTYDFVASRTILEEGCVHIEYYKEKQ